MDEIEFEVGNYIKSKFTSHVILIIDKKLVTRDWYRFRTRVLIDINGLIKECDIYENLWHDLLPDHWAKLSSVELELL